MQCADAADPQGPTTERWAVIRRAGVGQCVATLRLPPFKAGDKLVADLTWHGAEPSTADEAARRALARNVNEMARQLGVRIRLPPGPATMAGPPVLAAAPVADSATAKGRATQGPQPGRGPNPPAIQPPRRASRTKRGPGGANPRGHKAANQTANPLATPGAAACE